MALREYGRYVRQQEIGWASDEIEAREARIELEWIERRHLPVVEKFLKSRPDPTPAKLSCRALIYYSFLPWTLPILDQELHQDPKHTDVQKKVNGMIANVQQMLGAHPWFAGSWFGGRVHLGLRARLICFHPRCLGFEPDQLDPQDLQTLLSLNTVIGLSTVALPDNQLGRAQAALNHLGVTGPGDTSKMTRKELRQRLQADVQGCAAVVTPQMRAVAMGLACLP